MIYVAALLLGAIAGAIPVLASSPLDPRTGEMENKINPIAQGKDRDVYDKREAEGTPVEID